MYQVYCDSFLLYDDRLENLKIFEPKVDLEVNKTGSFTFAIYPDHPYFNQIKKLKSIITVYQDDFLLFRGRILNDEIGFYNEKQIECEGELAFLLDSIIRPYEFSGSIEEFLQMLLDAHNAQVDAAHQFTVGNVTVTDPNNTITRSSVDYEKTLDVINKSLIDLLGGYIKIRVDGSVRYIDYVEDLSTISSQSVEFAKNLLNLKRIGKGEDIATALIPLGAKVQDSEGNETDERLTIKSVNDGLDYIYDQAAVNQYGWIFASNTWDDVTLASNLLTKGKAYLAEIVNEPEILELSAADLATVDSSVTSFHIGTYLNAAINFSISSVNNKNTKSYKIEYKLQSASSWTALTSGSEYAMNKSLISASGFLNVDNSYHVRLSITDFFGTVTSTIDIPTAFTLIDWNVSGKGMAFGKVSEKATGIEFGLPLYSTLGHVINSPVELPSGSDLNNLLQPGHYMIGNTTVSASILNKPTTSTATAEITVTIAGNTNQLFQRYYVADKNNPQIYQRTYYQGSWGAWTRIAGNKVLWSGGMYMTEGHRITLAEPVVMQPSGISLVFSRYSNGAVADTNFNSFFVPKQFIDEKRGYGNLFVMFASPNLEMCAGKYLYINNEYITGHANNSLSGTSATGIVFSNNQFVLRYVIGV